MNPDKSTEDDLRARFATLREGETNEAPSFAGTLAAARTREEPPQKWPAPGWTIGALAAAVAITVLVVPRLREKTPGPSLAEVIPVLLPASTESDTLFPSPLFAESRLPSDSILPLHLDFPL